MSRAESGRVEQRELGLTLGGKGWRSMATELKKHADLIHREAMSVITGGLELRDRGGSVEGAEGRKQPPTVLGVVTVPRTLGEPFTDEPATAFRYYRVGYAFQPAFEFDWSVTREHPLHMGLARYYAGQAFDTALEREWWRRTFSVHTALEMLDEVSAAVSRGTFQGLRYVILDHPLAASGPQVDLLEKEAAGGVPFGDFRAAMGRLKERCDALDVILMGVQQQFNGTELIDYLDSLLEGRILLQEGGAAERPSHVFGNDHVFLNNVDPSGLGGRAGYAAMRRGTLEFVSELPRAIVKNDGQLLRHTHDQSIGIAYVRGAQSRYIRYEIALTAVTMTSKNKVRVRARQSLEYLVGECVQDDGMPVAVDAAWREIE